MGTITINVDDETEKIFREAVKRRSGAGKGILGKAIKEAMQKWIAEDKYAEIQKRQLAMLKKGFNLGKIKYKSRDELHERGNTFN